MKGLLVTCWFNYVLDSESLAWSGGVGNEVQSHFGAIGKLQSLNRRLLSAELLTRGATRRCA